MKRFLLLLLFVVVLFLAHRLVQISAEAEVGGDGHGAAICGPNSKNGDVNGDGSRDISDASALLNWLFLGGPEPCAIAQVNNENIFESIILTGPDGEGGEILFGQSGDCSIAVDPKGPKGLLLRDPDGIRVLNPTSPRGATQLIFGPTDECRLSVNPQGPGGLLLEDPFGIRVLGNGELGTRILFGQTDDCRISVNPEGPGGLLLEDPFGVRVLGDGKRGTQIIFGPTDECRLGVDPEGPGGLLLEDPFGIRVLSGDQRRPNALFFGPTDECRITVNPLNQEGMMFADPNGFLFDGVVSAEKFENVSTRRAKENIRPLENAIETISKLRGVSFDWKEEHGGTADIGFIAEEVADVVPEVVGFESDGETARGVRYSNLVALTVEGVKEQQQQIETLENENTALKRKVNDLEARLVALSETVARLADGAASGKE